MVTQVNGGKAVNDYKIYTAFLAVLFLLVPLVIADHLGNPQGSSSYTITSGGGSGTGGNTTLKADASSCSAANECTNGFCVHSICRSTSTYCGDSFCDSGESCSADDGACSSGYACTGGCVAKATTAPSGGGGAATPTPKAEEKKEAPKAEEKPSAVTPPVQVVPVEVPVTNTQTIQEVITAVKASDLGVDTIKIENIQVTKTGVAEATTTTQALILEKVVEEAVKVVTEESAKQVLNEIKQAVSTGTSAPVSVSTTVEVFEVKEKTTGKTAFASKITLTLKPEEDLKDVNIVEVISKSVAASISDVIFLGEQPKVLQADPVVQWSFPEVKKDETKDLSYQVAKKIETLETKTVAVAKAVVFVEVPPKPSLIFAYIFIGVILGGVAVYVVYKRIRKPGPFRYKYKSK